MRDERVAGFTLVELLIALAVIGVIAAIAIPNLLNALQRGRQKRTMSDLRAAGMAVEAYAMDANEYPEQPVEADLSGVSVALQPTYITATPDRDAWGTAMRYAGQGRAYTMTSYGRDKQPGGGGAVGPDGQTTSFASDIILSGGTFIQYPDGIQD